MRGFSSGLALCVGECGGHGEHGAANFLAKVGFGVGAKGRENHAGDLRDGNGAFAEFDANVFGRACNEGKGIVRAGLLSELGRPTLAHEAFGAVGDVLGEDFGEVVRVFADDAITGRRDANHRRHQSLASCALDDAGVTPRGGRDRAVGGAQIDADGRSTRRHWSLVSRNGRVTMLL